jgi:asparagine synthase (glutamine-hydrolysing)
MCGIAGIFSYGSDAPRVSRAEFLRLRDTMAARGPDGAGEWIGEDGAVGLAHRRLAIIDLSPGGAQPMETARGTSVISFNGEIYNYKELRAELEQKGETFRTQSDTEVILTLYEREGVDMLPKLRGMFTIIIWDKRRRGMLIARDPLGIKPIYYADRNGTLLAASQVKTLLAGGIDAALDPAGCVSFFVLGYVAEPSTIRKSVRALPAGHSLWIDASGVGTPRAFYCLRQQLCDAQQADQRQLAPIREVVGRALRSSVRAHMVADVPVGLFLSAGLDSTSLASLAKDCTDRPLRTLTVGFQEYRGTEHDEVPVAEEVAHAFRTDHTTLWVEGRHFLEDRDRLLQAMDQPTIDGMNVYFVSKAARQLGLKVALCGLGGDELFAGYPSYSQVPRIARILRPFHLLPGFGRAVRAASSGIIGRITSPKYAGLFEYGTSLEDAYLLRRALYMPWELPEVLDADLAREGWQALDLPARLRQTTAGLRGDRTRVAALEMTWYMRNQLLRDADWAGMAHSIEIRTPLVDARMLGELAPALAGPAAPSKLTMAQSTPAGQIGAVVARRKTGFTVPTRQWLADFDGQYSGDRGLRGWAKFVFQSHLRA